MAHNNTDRRRTVIAGVGAVMLCSGVVLLAVDAQQPSSHNLRVPVAASSALASARGDTINPVVGDEGFPMAPGNIDGAGADMPDPRLAPFVKTSGGNSFNDSGGQFFVGTNKPIIVKTPGVNSFHDSGGQFFVGTNKLRTQSSNSELPLEIEMERTPRSEKQLLALPIALMKDNQLQGVRPNREETSGSCGADFLGAQRGRPCAVNKDCNAGEQCFDVGGEGMDGTPVEDDPCIALVSIDVTTTQMESNSLGLSEQLQRWHA